jgi:hypothetical protein
VTRVAADPAAAAASAAARRLLLETADAWHDYLERTRDLDGHRYREVEPWAWRLLRERLRTLAARRERLHAS